MNFIAELKRRKLAQWTLCYAAGAWALLQAIGFMVESYDWPHTVSRIAIVVVAVGFFVTLVLAWYHGERGEQRVSRNELLLLALLLLIGGGFAWRTANAPVTALTNGSTAIDPRFAGERAVVRLREIAQHAAGTEAARGNQQRSRLVGRVERSATQGMDGHLSQQSRQVQEGRLT